MTPQHATHKTKDRRKKRAVIARFAFTGVAVLGIGAAATSAAWTDDAWFSATAGSASVELQGSLNGTTWSDADNSTASIVVPTATFAGMVPGQTRTVTLHLKNTSTVSLAVAAPVVSATGAMFTGIGAATATAAAPTTPILAGEVTTFVLTVATPSTWATSFQSTTGAITVQVTGTTVP